MTTYMATITASPSSQLFKGYSTCGMYFRMYKKIAREFNKFDNELVIENQGNGRPHIHSIFTTELSLDKLKYFLSQFYKLCKLPYADPIEKWTTTKSKYNGNIEYNYSSAIKLQVFDNKEDYFNKTTKTDKSYEEASYIWYLEMIDMTKPHEFYEIFYKNNKGTNLTNNKLLKHFDSINYDKYYDLLKSGKQNIYNFIKMKTRFTMINTPNEIVIPLNPFKESDLD